MTTIKEIAKQAGVAKSTVSRVLNNHDRVSDETKEKVLKVIKENNYKPNAIARGLSTKKSLTIGLFGLSPNSSEIFHLNHAFFRDILEGLEEVLAEKGYDMIYFTNSRKKNEFNFAEKCKNRHVDGAVFLGTTNDTDNLNKFFDSNIPAVFIDSKHLRKHVSYVTSDNYNGIRNAVEHLINLGHRDIGLLLGAENIVPAQERLLGYTDTMKGYNLDTNPEWIYHGDYTKKFGYQIMQEILKFEKKPTAIICQDEIAVGAMKAIRDNGLDVPGDVSIIGIDGLEISNYLNPALTTIKQQKEKIGEAAASLLLKIINEKNCDISPIILPTKLIYRDSCRSL